MKLLVYADLQATDGDERCFNDPNTPLQLFRVRKFYRDLYSVFTQNACAGLVDLGDTTDDRTAIPVPVIDAVIAGLEPFPVLDTNFKIIGNHEQYLRNASVDVGRMFSGRFNVLHNQIVQHGGNRVLFFVSYPEDNDHDKLARWLDTQTMKYRKFTKVLFGHFQIVGSALNSGPAVTGVPFEIIKRFDLALLGHIHKPQSFTSRIHYVGSPFQQNWGEADEAKRVALVDLDSLSVEWVATGAFPVYINSTLAGFKAGFDPASEDRWRVTLANHAETEEWFALPYSNRFEAVYAYETVGAEGGSGTLAESGWSLEGAMQRYMTRLPPSEQGIEIAEQELLEIGLSLARGET